MLLIFYLHCTLHLLHTVLLFFRLIDSTALPHLVIVVWLIIDVLHFLSILLSSFYIIALFRWDQYPYKSVWMRFIKGGRNTLPIDICKSHFQKSRNLFFAINLGTILQDQVKLLIFKNTKWDTRFCRRL